MKDLTKETYSFCLTQTQLGKHIIIFRYTLSFFYKQSVYKQLGLGWQIAKQLSGLIPISLNNNKNYR